MAFTHELLQGRLNWSLSKRGASTYRELMERAKNYATVEDIGHSKMFDMTSKPLKTSGTSRSKDWSRLKLKLSIFFKPDIRSNSD
ncbi:hypothetical protein LWI28_023602 [Acer negundo]|uniref:Uncharacterized protein n=1 Tax=Acer negundo TaxID=4023 RepID=A0AAD5NUT4_ACENE|nr:hypothetical protein LWI28_023602 [Acer negundo]